MKTKVKGKREVEGQEKHRPEARLKEGKRQGNDTRSNSIAIQTKEKREPNACKTKCMAERKTWLKANKSGQRIRHRR